ncbi:MAG: carbohydrate ABC transporter permease, partial [bacterium]
GVSPRRDWDRLARRAARRRGLVQGALIGLLALISVPILLPYFWLFTISVSARTGGVESSVLWKASAVLAAAAFALGLLRLGTDNPRRRRWGGLAVAAAVAVLLAALIGPELHPDNYRFMWIRGFVEELRGKAGAGGQFPWVWTAFANSLLLAGVQAVLVITVSTLAGYYISRFWFPGRSAFLQSLLVLHAFPAMTLIIPIFLMMHWAGLLDTLTGVVLVIVTLELPFSIFIMKGFFDAVPWDIEMSAMTDGASRRQAFLHVILPQVKVGVLAVGIFAFIRGWEEYVFVRTLLFEKSNWVMSLFLFWVSDDIMGVDYGIVAAVGVFYILPSLLLYIFCQKFLVQISLGGIKG